LADLPPTEQGDASRQHLEPESSGEAVSEGAEEQVAKNVIDLTSVSKEYVASGQPVRALDSVTFTVKEREVVAIIGPSGAGKTTLLNLIAGLEAPSDGNVRVLGIDIADSEERFLSSFRSANIGFIFQSYNLVSTLTAAENVELMMELAGWSDARRNEKLTSELINTVGLAERAQHLPSQLSGGEQQRVAIARALANDPPLILADEPTGNLDSNTGLEIVRLLARLRDQRHKTVVITTHDDRVVDLADTIYRLDKGKLEKIDRPTRLRD
jgi:putative ABC transport system ATP-binding protein